MLTEIYTDKSYKEIIDKIKLPYYLIHTTGKCPQTVFIFNEYDLNKDFPYLNFEVEINYQEKFRYKTDDMQSHGKYKIWFIHGNQMEKEKAMKKLKDWLDDGCLSQELRTLGKKIQELNDHDLSLLERRYNINIKRI